MAPGRSVSVKVPATSANLGPGFDTLGTLAHIGQTGYEHTWFVATKKIVEKEFALSGSEQNPDLTGKDVKLLLNRVKAGVSGPVQAFLDRGEDFVVARSLTVLLDGMQRLEAGTAGAATIRPGSDRATSSSASATVPWPFS